MRSSIWERRIWGIKIGDYTAVLLFYLFCALSYRITIWITGHGVGDPPNWPALLNFEEFLRIAGLDYFIKLLLTIPIWWLLFRKLKHIKLRYRLLLHLIGLPLFVTIFKYSYYKISEILDWRRLGGFGQAWDVYIPGLFYCFQFGIFHAFDYYYTNQKNLKLKNELSEAALKSELAALKAQLNPHFLYNVFNTISASVPPEQEHTRELIATLSDLFRYQLKASKSDWVMLEEELDFIKNYLQLEKARFEDRLKTALDVPENLLTEWIPPMILQPLVENAIKHGISPKIEGGKVTLKIRKEANMLTFKISDTGVGVKDKSQLLSGEGIGLKNTKLRLEKRYQSKMIFSDHQPSGLIIEFKLPLVPFEQVKPKVKDSHTVISTTEVVL